MKRIILIMLLIANVTSGIYAAPGSPEKSFSVCRAGLVGAGFGIGAMCIFKPAFNLDDKWTAIVGLSAALATNFALGNTSDLRRDIPANIAITFASFVTGAGLAALATSGNMSHHPYVR